MATICPTSVIKTTKEENLIKRQLATFVSNTQKDKKTFSTKNKKDLFHQEKEERKEEQTANIRNNKKLFSLSVKASSAKVQGRFQLNSQQKI